MSTMFQILVCLSLWIAHCQAQFGPGIQDADINLLTETLMDLLSTSQVTSGSGSVPVTNQYGISSSPTSLSGPDQLDLSAYGSGSVSQQPQTIVYQQSQSRKPQSSGQTYGLYIVQPISGEQKPLLGYGQSAPDQSGQQDVPTNFGITIQLAVPSDDGSQSAGYGSSGYQQQQPQYSAPPPQPSYPAPQPSYPAPQPSYPAPQPSYPAPQPSYPAPQPSYPAPQPSYPAPQPSYPAPQPSYPAPQPSYPAPQPSYPAPQPSYPAPQPSYSPPPPQYPAPQPTYAAPPKHQYPAPQQPQYPAPSYGYPQKPRYPKYPPKKRVGYGRRKKHYGYGKPKRRHYKKPELIEIPKGYVPNFDDLNPHEQHPVPHINKLFYA